MTNERHLGPVEMLRNLALSLERMAAHEAATGLVRGAAEGLRKEMPELDAQLRTLLQDVLTVLGRLAHEAARQEHVEPGAAAHALAGSAVKGALEVLEREWQDGGLPFHSFVERLNLLLDEIIEFAHSRTDEIRGAEERAQLIARGMVEAVVQRLHEAAPTLTEDLRALAPVGAELAMQAGRGLAGGIQSKLQEDSDALGGVLEHAGRQLARGVAAGLRQELAAHPVVPHGALANGTLRRVSRELTGGVLEALGASLRRPLLAMAGVGSALVALTVLSVRWRRA
jgi:hypothetical protein